jgi:hypothetical protein
MRRSRLETISLAEARIAHWLAQPPSDKRRAWLLRWRCTLHQLRGL